MSPSEEACDLASRKCRPCEGGVPALPDADVERHLAGLPGWERDGVGIAKTYSFENHHVVMAFVNAIAWVSHREDHHPDLRVGYRECRVHYHTHAIGGLSENDLICAAKVESLLDV